MTDLAGFRQINEMVEREARFVQVLDTEIRKAIVGQDRLVERALVALLADGHILLEGVPGLAKTLLVKTIGQAIQAGFSRIQFTPDLLPADLIGTRIYNPRTGDFSVQKGPVFSNLILADEVNRAPAKVQSALLEAMQEKQVTIGNETFPLDAPFLVLATQNPIEQEGTYPAAGGSGRPFHAQGHCGLPRAFRGAGDYRPDDVRGSDRRAAGGGFSVHPERQRNRAAGLR